MPQPKRKGKRSPQPRGVLQRHYSCLVRKTLLTLAILTLASTPAQADTKIPSTKVSYTIKKDSVTGANASMVFIDAEGDPSGKTYMAFVCDNGEPFARLYSKVSLGATGEQPATYFSSAGASVRRLSGIVREDYQTGKPTVLDMTASSTAQLMRVFTTTNKVSVRIERLEFSALSLTFSTNGFIKAWQAIHNCD